MAGSKEVTVDTLRRLVERFNAHDLDAATSIIMGTARSMGIEVKL